MKNKSYLLLRALFLIGFLPIVFSCELEPIDLPDNPPSPTDTTGIVTPVDTSSVADSIDVTADGFNSDPDKTFSELWEFESEPEPEPGPDPFDPAVIEADFQTFVARATGKTHSAQNPMGKHYNGRIAATSDQLAWLADPTQEPNSKPGYANKALPGQANTAWVTYSTFKLYPFGNPSPVDVNQHSIGDCCLCASLAEMAYLYPDFIKQHVITDNGNGTFSVAMYDPVGNPITVGVSNKFLANNTQVGGKDGPSWSTVMEKAVIKWESCFEVDQIGGIGTEVAIPLFTGTGDSFAFSPGALSASEMDRCVDVMLSKHMLTIGGFRQSDVSITVKLINHDGTFQYNADGSVKTVNATTVSGHAFSFMLSVDPDALFSMRNPWGSNPANGRDGTLDIPDNGQIQPMIDIRIVYPGAAAPYATPEVKPYFRPW